jgi:hypothetical protein
MNNKEDNDLKIVFKLINKILNKATIFFIIIIALFIIINYLQKYFVPPV